jgi:hypothetical protein
MMENWENLEGSDALSTNVAGGTEEDLSEGLTKRLPKLCVECYRNTDLPIRAELSKRIALATRTFGGVLQISDTKDDRLCSLVARVAGYRSRGPGSIPRATRFSEK